MDWIFSAVELHIEDPQFATAASTDDQAQKDTQTNPSAPQSQRPPQSSSVIVVEVRLEVLRKHCTAEHLAPPVVFKFERRLHQWAKSKQWQRLLRIILNNAMRYPFVDDTLSI